MVSFCTNRKPKIYNGVLSLKDSFNINISEFAKKIPPEFGFHSIKLNDTFYIGFMDKFLNIHLCEVNHNPKIISYKLPDSVKLSENFFSIKFFENTVYVYLHNKKQLISLNIKDSDLKVNETYDLSKVLAKDEYLLYADENTFEIKYPFVFIAYGRMDRKNNYLDQNRYLLIDLTKNLSPQNTIKILHTQETFIDKKYYEYNNTNEVVK